MGLRKSSGRSCKPVREQYLHRDYGSLLDTSIWHNSHTLRQDGILYSCALPDSDIVMQVAPLNASSLANAAASTNDRGGYLHVSCTFDFEVQTLLYCNGSQFAY